MMRSATLRTLLIVILISLGFLFLLYTKNKPLSKDFPKGPTVEKSEIYEGVTYEPVQPGNYKIDVIVENLLSPTRIKLTPDNKHLLVTQLTGEVLALDKTQDGWSNPYLVTRVDTKFPGFPPDEAGLTGLALSSDFDTNKKVFLLYTFKEKSGKIQNRISSFVLNSKDGKLTGSIPKKIFQANIAGNTSHQITDGFGTKINGENRLVFLIGEGFEAKRAQDISLQAGKLMSIKEDGTNAVIHAIGLRNGYVFSKNPADTDGKWLISDTGPDKYDRLIYTNPFNERALNFGWNGNQEDLAQPIQDPNFDNVKDMVIFRYPETRTFTGIDFSVSGQVLITLFGKTGYKDNAPGKEILLGKIENIQGQPTITLKTIIKRVKEAQGKYGNPLGMTIDTSTGNFFFADVIEGRIYSVKNLKGGEYR